MWIPTHARKISTEFLPDSTQCGYRGNTHCGAIEGVKVVADTVRMGRSKKPGPDRPEPDREKYRKPFRPARIKAVLAVAAELRAVELAQDFTQYVNDAVRMRLEQEGRWPPK